MPTDPSLGPSLSLALEYAVEASGRVRKIVLLLVVASIVTVIAWWNQYDHGWTTVRLNTAQDALRYVCQEAWVADSCQGGFQEPLTKLQADRAAAFLKEWRFTRKQLERHIQDIQDQYVSGVLKINVPFFGLTSDVNDLGMLSGIALGSLMALCLFTVWREEQNVKLLFEMAEEHKVLSSILTLFAMTQVFTIPPWYKERGARRVTLSLYLMPSVAYLLVVSYDARQAYLYPQLLAGSAGSVHSVCGSVRYDRRWDHYCIRVEDHEAHGWPVEDGNAECGGSGTGSGDGGVKMSTGLSTLQASGPRHGGRLGWEGVRGMGDTVPGLTPRGWGPRFRLQRFGWETKLPPGSRNCYRG